MWDDPREPTPVRQLLRAGRVEREHYDVESGLARHLANLQAGAPLPGWAVQATAPRALANTLMTWILPPVLSALALGGWTYFRHSTATPVLTSSAVAVAAESAAGPAAEPAALAVPTDTAVVRVANHAAHVRDLEAGAQRGPVVESRRATALSRAQSLRAEREAKRDARARRALRASGQGRSSATLQAKTGPYEDALALESSGGGVVSAASPTGADSSGTSITTDSTATRAREPEAVAARPASEPEAQRAPEESVRQEPGGPSTAPRAPQPVAQVESDSRLEREMQMLAVAQRVLADDPERTLRLARQGEREFPRSMFSAERKQLALLALVQLGRLQEARRSAAPFLRAYPSAPWTPRLREALATGKIPAP